MQQKKIRIIAKFGDLYVLTEDLDASIKTPLKKCVVYDSSSDEISGEFCISKITTDAYTDWQVYNGEFDSKKYFELKSKYLDLEAKRDSIDMDTDKILAIKDCIFGLVVGDALGVPVEFLSREQIKNINMQNMFGYGTHHQPKGSWSDDTAMTLATMNSIIETGGIDYKDIMDKFLKWYYDAAYTSTGVTFGVGGVVKKSLKSYESGNPALQCGQSGDRDNGNGSLMRFAPIALFCAYQDLSEEEESKLIDTMSSLTHAHETSRLGCRIYTDFIKMLILDKSKEEAYAYICSKNYEKNYKKETVDKYKDILGGKITELLPDNIKQSGYVVDTLIASMYSTMSSESYEEAVIKSIKLGYDTDTVGAVTGSINGIIYGINGIPIRWIQDLKNLQYLCKICDLFEIELLMKKENYEKRK